MGVADTTGGPTGRAGLHVALLGIDGAGKSTLVGELEALAKEQGVPVRKVSWRAFIEQQGTDDAYPLEAMRRLWVRSFQLYFADAVGPDGARLDLPTSYDDLNRRGGTEYLNGLAMSGQPAQGPLASAWIELAANTLLHREVIGPLVAQGHLVLQESYGYKHLLKLLAYADKLDGVPGRLTAGCREFVRSYFGTYLKPDVGLYMAATPSVALRWRLRQTGQLGTFETYANTGADPQESFLEMQGEAAASFDDFAERFAWTRVDIKDVSRAENLRMTLQALRATPLAGLLGLDGQGLDELRQDGQGVA